MTTAIKRRRGTTTQHSTFTGLEGEITIDTTKDTAVVHDGATAGGRPLLREDLANNTEVVTKTGTQTLTNKTLTSPVINTPTGITKGDISLGNVDNTSDATKNSATATLTNKTITLGANTISGTVAQFQAAVTDGDFATLAGTETFTNKALNGTLGATTPSTVAATTISASGVSTFSAGSAGAPAITTAGDTNTGIFFPAADTIAFAEGGVESMRINSAGNIGLGVTPATWSSSYRALQFGSQAILSSVITGTQASQLGLNWYADSGGTARYIGTGNASLYNQFSGQHVWYTAPSGTAGNAITFTDRMTLDVSGNLALGVSTAAAKFDVAFSDNSRFLLGFGANLDNYYTSGTSGAQIFRTGTTERMRLDSSGNLGLGVTPSAWGGSWKAVDVSGGGAFAGAFNSAYMLGNAYYNASKGVYKATGPAGHYGIEAGTHVWKTAPSGTAGNAITFTQAMTLDASSNLTVTGSVSGGGVFNIVGSGAAPASGYGIRTKSGLGTEIVSAYKIGFSVNSGTSDAMTLNDSGILTVSTPGTITNGAIKIQGATTDYQGLSLYYAASSPNASARAWQIAPNYIGYARLDFLISSSSSTDPITSKGYIDGTTGAYVAVSDLRAKKNIADCSYGLAEVLAMRPVIYNMIEEEDGTDKHLGFIAQEIKKVVNEAVSSTSTEEELYGLDKAGLIPILVKAIQEQQAMIDELKAKVAALEAA